MPLVSLDHISIAYGHLPLLDDASLRVEAGERVCIIGRNGTGKSTLLQILSGDVTPDAGAVWRQPGIGIARLVQDVPLVANRPVFDVVAEGLGSLGDLVADFHHAATEVASAATGQGPDYERALARLGRLQHELEERDGWRMEQRVELVMEHLELPADTIVDTLSGGWRRRVLLARALVAQPDLLLLDEPTNHLDIESMTWLEEFLGGYAGAVVFVTHDRVFLQNVATRIVELDRGMLTSWPGDYSTFLRKKDEWLANEATLNDKFDKRLAKEEAWLRQGVKARRTRDEGRVRALLAMRKERAERRALVGAVRLQAEAAERPGQLVFEAKDLSKSFGAKSIVRDFSLRVIRGDRIGLIGPNGSGKTTLLRMLIGDLTSDSGEVRRGENVEVAYYDQQREQLDPERSVFDTVGDGNDTVTVNGRPQHVHGYLRDFLFPPERAESPVKALSGGERNRLLLARLFTRPANVLVLDEPTNDLDIETLELLESYLIDWPGTLLLVSHDRAFIDDVVTSTLVFEGAGRVQEYVGGYEDWLRQRSPDNTDAQLKLRPTAGADKPDAQLKLRPTAGADNPEAQLRLRPTAADTPAGRNDSVGRDFSRATGPSLKKLTYREQQELRELPGRIDALEREQEQLNASVADPAFYRSGADAIAKTLGRLDAIRQELLVVYARWDELDSRRGRN